jgi:hypothetical protein
VYHAGFGFNTKAEKQVLASVSAMAKLPAENVKLIQHVSIQVGATYTKGETVYKLQALTTQYAECSCLHSIDGNFCKHQLLALQQLYLSDSWSMPEHQQRFRALCVRVLGTDFERGSWCGMRDGMATKKAWPTRLRRCEGVRKPSTTPCFGGLATGDGGDSETS